MYKHNIYLQTMKLDPIETTRLNMNLSSFLELS